MPGHKLVLTSNGATSPALHAAVLSLLGTDPKQATCWYIPTAPLRDGWSEGQARQQMASIKAQFGLKRIEWIDPEYVKGDALVSAIQKLGRVDMVYAEMVRMPAD